MIRITRRDLRSFIHQTINEDVGAPARSVVDQVVSHLEQALALCESQPDLEVAASLIEDVLVDVRSAAAPEVTG